MDMEESIITTSTLDAEERLQCKENKYWLGNHAKILQDGLTGMEFITLRQLTNGFLNKL